MEWKDGAFRAGPFELGRFYVSNGFVIELADAQLAPVHGPVFVEVYDDADLLSRTLDGAEAAVVKLAFALGQFFTSPLDSLAALKDLPAGVAALIASSPEYFERFRYMTRGEQVQAVAELATGLLVTKGTVTSATRTVTGALAGAEATVPVLSLSAQGALTLERVAVPVGRAAAVVGGGPGAVILLQRANVTVKPTSETYPETYFAGAYWGPRRESPEECAHRTAAFLNLLASCDPFLSHWYKPAKSRADARKHPLMPPDVLSLAELFRRGVNREKGGPVIEDLGFRVWIHNGGAPTTTQGCVSSAGITAGPLPTPASCPSPVRGRMLSGCSRPPC